MTKKDTKKTTSKKKAEKYALIDLIQQSQTPYPQIMMNLHKEGLVQQYEQEQELKAYGCPIKPTLTLEEFKKIVEA